MKYYININAIQIQEKNTEKYFVARDQQRSF